ncbi:UPF0158 family protein [Nitriliruptor alkaliphilus]|uniref:UPF0158 family protein n=1 Tax=Nitriliruptor alkaliphilus TaxID=427918 RepID=UPI000ABEEAC0|nr:UPF0158 family protein [Nitriliruptor alkaliphilus]
MARTWLSIQVDLIEGAHAPELWPRPGRLLLARPGMTFRMLADAINQAFARWDLAHLHAFTLADGTRIAYLTDWDEGDDLLDDRTEKLTRLQLGERFSFEFDFGDGWMHLCTVGEEKVDPHEVLGELPDRPVPYFGWGAIPDQYGRRWDEDDGESPVPPPPEPLLSDLPDLHHDWGSRAFTVGDGSGGEVVPGPWPTAGLDHGDQPPLAPWTYATIQDLRRAVHQRDAFALVDLLLEHEPLEVAHLAGPALIDAIAGGHDVAQVVVEGLLPNLGTRGWLGDDELVADLERATGDHPDQLRPTPVDLDELATHLEGPTDLDEGWALEVATGRCWPRDPVGMAGIEEPEDFDDPDRFVVVLGLGSGVGYRDMTDFIDQVTDEQLAGRLEVAVQGRGAFRRFKDTLFDDEVWWSRWATFSAERQLARARWWLAEAGLRPATLADAAPTDGE